MADDLKEVREDLETKRNNQIDLRGQDFKDTTHVFNTEDVETIETYGKDSDIKVQLLNGKRVIFRCSCCVLFTCKGTKIRIS